MFGALADPTRRAILASLAGGEKPVGEVAKPFNTSLPAITKHLNVLEQAGLITRKAIGRQKICKAEPLALEEAMTWMTFYRQFWNDRLDALEAILAEDMEP
ncbi:MAG: metalloregulator ArsR/SmtB family transcription factor [Armatimonadota bacterium]